MKTKQIKKAFFDAEWAGKDITIDLNLSAMERAAFEALVVCPLSVRAKYCAW